jgi:CubicO group peptidase (beta-lactamase class C family)
MKPLALASVLVTAAALPGCSTWRLDLTAQAATGFASQVLCDDIFISGQSAQSAFDERLRPLAGMRQVVWAMGREVNTGRREVRVSLAGGFESLARYRPDTGCVNLPAGDAAPGQMPAAALPEPADDVGRTLPPAPDPWGDAPRVASSADLRAILDAAVAPQDNGSGPPRSKALVVLHHGAPVGEAYAHGVRPDTPLLAFSVSKSLTAALAGVLMQQGRLSWDQRAPVAAWSDPADPRHAITLEHLLRQTSGLDLPQDNSGTDATTRLMYGGTRDKAAGAAAAALAAPPGARWAYTDAHYMLLSRVIRDAVGGRPGDVQRFAQAELFGPAGMRHVVMDTDASGTPMGSSHLLAAPRDLARLGQLLLDDGVVNGRRLLPQGWVGRVTTPTLATGYGAGFWTNHVGGAVPRWGAPWGLPGAPGDTYFARGFMGQFIVVVPSRRVVIVRMSASPRFGDDIEETDRLVVEILKALPADGGAQPAAS